VTLLQDFVEEDVTSWRSIRTSALDWLRSSRANKGISCDRRSDYGWRQIPIPAGGLL